MKKAWCRCIILSGLLQSVLWERWISSAGSFGDVERDEWCCLKGRLACGGAAGPLRWRPVTHSQSREARPQSAPFTAPVCTHTHTHTHTHRRTSIKTYSNISKHTVTRILSHTLKCLQTCWQQGALIKWELSCSSSSQKGKVCVHISGPSSLRGLCVCMWARRLLWVFPPTQSPIPNVDWKAKKQQKNGSRLWAGSGPESRCAFLTSPASPSSHLQPLIYSQACLKHLICPGGKHGSMSRLPSVCLGCLKPPSEVDYTQLQ